MNILITHAYSNNNKGDAALLSVLVHDVSQAFPHASTTILTLDHISSNEHFEGIPMQNALMYYVVKKDHHLFLQGLRACFLVISTLLWGCLYRLFRIEMPLPKSIKPVVQLYKNADLIIPVGGGYILSKRGFINTARLFFTVYPFIFSRVLRKITINYAQSVGSFGSKFQELLAKYSVKQLTGIIARESISMELLKRWNIQNCYLSVDSGFAFTSPITIEIRQLYNIPLDRMVVGITVRKWFSPEKQMQYERSVAAFCDRIIQKHNAFIVFIPQVTVEYNADDDRESSKRTYGYMQSRSYAHVATEHYDHYTIKAMYAGLDYLVGTRFHSVIFSLTSHVPSLAIGYEYKTKGIMDDLGLSQWVISIEQVQVDELESRFDALIAQRVSYIAHLQTVLPAYIKQSKNNITIVKELYETNKVHQIQHS